ncbi:hypothetical protein KF728_27525 [Candidatus Obscuribacterales bacterium]|nr:hypothetical protein [Candidatus Obscuribacterales bacterium]
MDDNHITYNSQNAENSDIQRVGRIIISLIIVAYFSIVLIQVSPSGEIRDRVKPYVDPIILLFGLKQRWNLFSPDIRIMNQYATCLITFKDGSIRLYEWPENRKFSFSNIERNQLRKFVVDGVSEPHYAAYWPDTARFLARANWNVDNPPVLVEPTFNGMNVPSFDQYTKQRNMSFSQIEHRTVQLPFFVRHHEMSRGGVR